MARLTARTENLGLKKFMEELRRLNPEGRFEENDQCGNGFIFGDVPTVLLVLPEGYYYTQKNGITNKHNTKSGMYETFPYEYTKI